MTEPPPNRRSQGEGPFRVMLFAGFFYMLLPRSISLRLIPRVLMGFPLFASSAALAQQTSAEDAAAAASCLACGGTMIMIPIAVLVLNIALLVWVAKDAKARGMENPVLWMMLVLFTSLIGLAIYWFTRPQGVKEACSGCGNNRLPSLSTCPHCGRS